MSEEGWRKGGNDGGREGREAKAVTCFPAPFDTALLMHVFAGNAIGTDHGQLFPLVREGGGRGLLEHRRCRQQKQLE